jgi:hypothetical protein
MKAATLLATALLAPLGACGPNVGENHTSSGVGAASSTGSAGGTAEIPMPLPCDALPDAGTFELATPPPAIDFAIISVAVDESTPGTVYVGTGGLGGDKGSKGVGLFKSLDCGSTWTHIDTGMNGSSIDSGGIWWTAVDPTDSRVVYTTSGYGGLGFYKSTNGGVDWADIRPTVDGAPSPNFTQVGSIDPMDHNHLVISFHANCTGSFAPVCLGESHDGGATWTLVKGPPQLANWGEAGGPIALGDLIIYDVPWYGTFSTADHGKTWTQALGYPGCFPNLAVSPLDGAYYMGCVSPFGLAKSTDKGMTWTTIQGAPWGNGIAATTQYLYMTDNGKPNNLPFFRAPLGDTTSWKNAPSPQIPYSANYLAYDSNHHVLYGANQQGGLWRLVTE